MYLHAGFLMGSVKEQATKKTRNKEQNMSRFNKEQVKD